MIFDKQSNGRRTTVESKSNCSCNRGVTDPVDLAYGRKWRLPFHTETTNNNIYENAKLRLEFPSRFTNQLETTAIEVDKKLVSCLPCFLRLSVFDTGRYRGLRPQRPSRKWLTHISVYQTSTLKFQQTSGSYAASFQRKFTKRLKGFGGMSYKERLVGLGLPIA